MKILHISPTYFPAYRYGGPIESVHKLNKWLVKKGVDVTVYTTDIDGRDNLDVPLGKSVDVDGVRIYYFPITFRPWQYSRLLHCALAKNVKDFDLIHITSVFLSVSTLGAYYAKKFRKPYIISPQGSLMAETLKKKSLKKNFYLNLFEKRNLRNAIIHFTTEMEKREYLNFNLPLKDSIVIPNGLDTEFKEKVPLGFFREKFKIPNNKKIVLFLSRLSWKKGFDTLIPAFAEVVKKKSNTVLIIVGGDDEGYKKEIEKQIANSKLQIGKDVVFTGMILGKDKIAAYQDSNVFVLPSYSENFGIVVLEAAYFSLPVVVTKGVAVGVEFGEAGAAIVVEKNVKDVSEAVLRVLKNQELAGKIRVAGKKLVEVGFSWSQIAENFLRVYKNLLL